VSDYYLGIDGGGTSTRALLANNEGRVCGIGTAGSSNYHHAGVDGTARALVEVIDTALNQANVDRNQLTSIFLGMAGVVNRSDHEAIERAIEPLGLTPKTKVGIGHDIRIALTGGLAGASGIALIAGTGSSCYGRNESGHAVQCGGWGALVDDVGSAYWMGVEALKAAVRQADGRLPPSNLRETIFRAIEIDDIRDFLARVHGTGMKRDEIATLAPVVMDLVRAGDATAAGILAAGTEGLAEMVQTAADRLGLHEPPVVVSGGLWSSGEPFQSHLCEAIRRRVPKAAMQTATLTPVQGAALEARRLVRDDAEDRFLESLNKGLLPC